MTKKIIETTWKNNLKDNHEKWIPYYEKLLQRFFKTKQWKEIKKNKTINKYGRVFEYIVAFAIADMKNKGFEYVVQKESAIGFHPNDGVDLIVPLSKKNNVNMNRNELWIIQVKTGKRATKKISSGLIKLEERARRILVQAQDSGISAKEFSQNWKVSNKLAYKIKKLNDWDLKTFWVTDNKKQKPPKMMYAPAKSIIQLIVEKSHIKHPSLCEATRNMEFEINSDFSNNKAKTIVLEKNKIIDTIIAPVKIADLLLFLEQVDKEDTHIDSLFASNVRDNKGTTSISKKIFNTLNDNKKPFFAMNNGIVMLCKKMKHESNGIVRKISLTNVDIINGQQTIRSIWNAKNAKKDFKLKENAKQKYILLHVFLNDDDQKARLISGASNNQSSISAFEIVSTFSFNRILQENLLNDGLFYSYRTGKTEYSKQFSSFSKITLKEILKYASIKFDGNVWAKNNLNSIMKEIAFGPSISKVSELVKTKDDKEINRNFATIASMIAHANHLKNSLSYAQSFDIFASLFMQNEAKARAFLGVYNQQVEKLIKTKEQEGKIPGKNVANIFKARKHTGDFYEEIKQEFEAFRF